LCVLDYFKNFTETRRDVIVAYLPQGSI